MSYVLAFLGFAALIILHEAGHFLAAKAVGMRVERFSLFFGPLLVKFRRGETEYGIGPIPLGGYVKITGMSPAEDIPAEVVSRAYYNQPVWKRIVVILAGPAVNLLIAFVIVWVIFMSPAQGNPNDRVASVLRGYPAAAVLHPGDRIVSVDGASGSSEAMRAAIGRHHCLGVQRDGCLARTPARLIVRRGPRLLEISVRPRYSAQVGQPILGFEFGLTALGPVHAAGSAVSGLWRVTEETVSVVARLFEPRERGQLHSVVGAYKVTQQRFAADAQLAFETLALISLSLAVINLFPFLPLDGGHVFWALAEKIRGRRIPFVVMERAGMVGFVLILVVFAIGLTNDISTLSGSGFGTH